MGRTAEGLVRWCEGIIAGGRHVYWYGTYCNPCTSARLASKTRQYPEHYRDSRQAAYRGHILEERIATDCVGLIKGFYWEKDGVIQYRRDGLPDKGAKGMYSAAEMKGPMAQMPEIPGLLVWTKDKGHVGVYVGGGFVVEAQGFAYGVQRNELRRRSFAHWGLCPYIEYAPEDVERARTAMGGEASSGALEETPETVGRKPENEAEQFELDTLRMGCEGTQVRALQWMLNQRTAGICGAVDGVFGKKTLAAVRRFQEAQGLDVDGVVGRKTWGKLLA